MGDFTAFSSPWMDHYLQTPFQSDFSPCFEFYGKFVNVYRKSQYKHVYRRRIEIPQRTHLFETNCWLKVHNAPLKLASSISGYDCNHSSFRPKVYND